MPKLVCILSVGHSGSTLLDLVIGSLEGVFSTGEMKWFAWQLARERFMEVSVQNQNICTCLRKFSECEVWSRVISSVVESCGTNTLRDNPMEYRMAFYRPSNRYDTPPDILTRIASASVTRQLAKRGEGLLTALGNRLNRTVIQNNWNVLSALSAVTRARYVVDSSKSFLRMYHLYSCRPGDVCAVVLVRDIYGHAYSCSRRDRQPERAARLWVRYYTNLFNILQNLEGIPYLLVRYEDLCDDPVAERSRIAAFLGLPEPESGLCIDTSAYHLVSGNPSRYAGKIRISEDLSWREGLGEENTMQIRAFEEQAANVFGEWLKRK